MSTPPDAEPMSTRARWQAFAVCLGAGFMTLLDVTIVNVALPSIERSLDAGPSDLQWIVAGYALAFGLVLVPSGRLGDLLGRRTMFLSGLTAFVLASAACGLATSATALAVLRLAQGVSAAMLNPQIAGLIQQLFTGAERARAWGWFGAVVGVSSAAGPLIGGLLLAAFGEPEGWRSVFLVNLPIGAVLIPLAARLLPRDPGRARSARRSGAPAGPRGRRRLEVDVVGLTLLGAGVLSVMLPFVLASEAGLGAAPWWLLSVWAVATALFWWWERALERRGGEPVLPIALVRTRAFVYAAGVGTAYFAGFTAIFLAVTLYLQTGLGLTPLQAGLVLTPFALTGSVSAAFSGRLVPRFGRWTVVAGLIIMTIGLVGTMLAVEGTDGADAAWPMAAWMALGGVGNGVVISPNQALGLADVPVQRSSTAGAVLQTSQRIGSAVGVAMVTAVFFATLGGSVAAGPAEYGHALSTAMLVSIGLVLAALVVALADAARRSRDVAPVSPAGGPRPGPPSH